MRVRCLFRGCRFRLNLVPLVDLSCWVVRSFWGSADDIASSVSRSSTCQWKGVASEFVDVHHRQGGKPSSMHVAHLEAYLKRSNASRQPGWQQFLVGASPRVLGRRLLSQTVYSLGGFFLPGTQPRPLALQGGTIPPPGAQQWCGSRLCRSRADSNRWALVAMSSKNLAGRLV